jgi:hypothetical protein
VAGQGGELEVEEGMDVERAGLVLFVEFDVARFMHFAVEHALADQELRPLEIRIAGEQGVVEVEECQVHGVPPCRAPKEVPLGDPKAAVPIACEHREQ